LFKNYLPKTAAKYDHLITLSHYKSNYLLYCLLQLVSGHIYFQDKIFYHFLIVLIWNFD